MSTKPRLVPERKQATDEDLYPVPRKAEFELDDEGRSIPVDFLDGSDIERIAKDLIEKYPCFDHLKLAQVAYLWKREGGKRKGRATLGTCQKPSGLLRFYSSVDFVVCLSADYCRALQFTYRQIEALLFHELKHTFLKVTDEGPVFTVLGHDWEGFADEVKEFGVWSPDMAAIKDAFQGKLFPGDDE